MIKVNLLRDKLQIAVEQNQVGGSGVKISGSENSSGNSPAVKLLIIMLFPAALYFYEGYVIDDLNQKVNAARVINQQLDSKIQKIESQSTGAQKKQNLIKEIDDKIKFIRELSKTRLLEVKALDTLQSILPESLWFERLDYAKGVFTIAGKSYTQKDYQNFLSSLESSNFFESTLTKKGLNVDVNKQILFEFELTTSMKKEL